MTKYIFNYGHKCACKEEIKSEFTEPASVDVHNVCLNFLLDDFQLQEVKQILNNAIDNALDSNTSSLKSYIWDFIGLPNRSERGQFLALDLESKVFKVVLIDIKTNKSIETFVKEFTISKSLLVGPVEELFDFISECLFKFLSSKNLQDSELSLGFTFVPETQQIGRASAIVKTCVTEFCCTGLIDKDIVQHLREAIERRGDLRITVNVFLNETLGALLAGSWKYENCKIGLYLGQICNACYLKQTVNYETVDDYNNLAPDNLFVDTQWFTLGDDGLLDDIRTDFDVLVDYDSVCPGHRTFEKMTSLKYLGEIARHTIFKLAYDGVLFCNDPIEIFSIGGRFPTKFMSEIQQDCSEDYKRCREILEGFSITHPTREDCKNVKYVCECICRRSANLVSAGISTLMEKIDDENVTLAVDGPLYMYHPFYHLYLVENIRRLTKPDIMFSICRADYGRGKGAALASAVLASQIK